MISLLLAFADPDSPVAAPSDSGIRLLDYVRDGGLLSYVLILLSVVAVASAVYNLIELRMDRQAPPGMINNVTNLFREGRYEEAAEYVEMASSEGFLARVLRTALKRSLKSPFGMMEFRSSLEAAGPPEVDRLHRLNDLIGIIAAVGPMLGLFGTVIGMIGAFKTIGTLTGAQRSNELATFMSMALVNTAEGLIVAIPCTVAFALFRKKVDVMIARIGEQLEELALIAQGPAQAATPGQATSADAPRRRPQPAASSGA